MPKVVDLLKAHGRSAQIAGKPATILRSLLREKSPNEIAGIFKVTRQAIVYCAARLGVKVPKAGPGRPALIDQKAEKLGYSNIEAYFRDRSRKTFGSMSKELGVSCGTIQRYHQMWLDRIAEVNRTSR